MASAARDVAGRRYALAIRDLARQDGSFEHWAATLEGLAALTGEANFVNALQTDGMTDERFQQIVRQVVPDVTADELNLARLLRRKGRLALGPSIASYFQELWDEERGVQRATVRTAVPLDDAQRAALERQLSAQSGKRVELTTEVDPSLIGGAVVRMGDRLVDGSVRTRLRLLRERLQSGA